MSWSELPLLVEEREKQLGCGGEKGERAARVHYGFPIFSGGSWVARGWQIADASLPVDDNGSCSWSPGDFWKQIGCGGGEGGLVRRYVYQGWCIAWEQSPLIHLHPELSVVIQEHSLTFVS